MVEFLVFNFVPIPVTSAEWTKVTAGARVRMFDGSLMVRVRAEKWEARMATPPMPPDDAAGVVAAMESGIGPATGEAIYRRGLDQLTAEIEVTRIVPHHSNGDFQEQVEFVLREV